MGLLEDIARRAQMLPPALPFPDYGAPPVDEAALAEEARTAAGKKLALANRKRPADPLTLAPDASSAGVQLAMGNAPEGTGVPFSTGAGMLAPPITIPPEAAAPVPLPVARPPEADLPGATDISSRAKPPGAPVQITPQETAGSAPVGAPAGMLDGGPSILDRLRTGLSDNSNTLLAIGAGFAGAPNIGQGISRAAATAIPASQADIKNKLTRQSQAYGTKALIDAGVPVQQAIAAAGNPDLKKALIKNYIEDRKHELKTVKDWMGNESLVDFDPFTSKAKPVDMGSGGGTNGAVPGVPSSGIMAAAKMEPSYDPTTHRDEGFLDAVKKADPMTASAIEDIASGKMPATGRNLQKLMPLVSRYENGFEANRYSARQNLEKSYYGGGEGAKALRSANTTIDHGIDLKKAIDDLHNYSVLPGYLNPITGKFAENMGDKKYQDVLARFKSSANIYSKELEVALTGKSTVSGQKEIHDLFDPYASPVANQSALQQTLGMLEKRVGEHQNTYQVGMNKPNHSFDVDLLTNRPKLDKLLAGDTGSGLKGAAAPAVAAPAAPVLRPGGSYKMLPDGTLVPK